MGHIAALGWVLIAAGCVCACWAANVADQMKPHRVDQTRIGFVRWPGRAAEAAYRPAGLPLFSQLRRALAATYACIVAGIILVIVASSTISR